MARPQVARIPCAGAILAVRHYAGSGVPIVLLHGGPGMGDYLGGLADLLNLHHPVVTYDQRGCGPSTCEGSFAVADQIADLETIRARIGADRLHLLGHSWGGLLAQLYARAHPDRVASLVLCCSMANTGSNVAKLESKGIAERVIARKKKTPAWAAAGLLMQLPGKLGDRGYGYVMRQLMPHYVFRPESALKTYDVTHASKRAWTETGKSIRALADDYLAGFSVDVPVMIVRGEQDVIRETGPILEHRFPAARSVVIPEAAHFPWLEQPEAFTAAVRDFYDV